MSSDIENDVPQYTVVPENMSNPEKSRITSPSLYISAIVTSLIGAFVMSPPDLLTLYIRAAFFLIFTLVVLFITTQFNRKRGVKLSTGVAFGSGILLGCVGIGIGELAMRSPDWFIT